MKKYKTIPSKTQDWAVSPLKEEYENIHDSFNDRVFQFIGVSIWFFMLVSLLLGPTITFLYCFIFHPITRYYIFAYILWMIYDRDSAITGYKPGLIKRFILDHSYWDYFRAYFPATLVRTHVLSPTQKYIFGVHPHGVYTINVFSNIIFNRNFKSLFPCIETLMITLPANFWFPVWREYALLLGGGTCTSDSILYRLKHGDPGTAVIIALGGAEEFKHLAPGTMDLVIRKRKGFARLALISGAHLVPVIGFGENDIFTIVKHPALDVLHRLCHLMFKSAAPLFKGAFGVIPKRYPLVTVFGKPIIVKEAVCNPTKEQIDALHQAYLVGLQDLYDEYKDVYHVDRVKEMRFVL